MTLTSIVTPCWGGSNLQKMGRTHPSFGQEVEDMAPYKGNSFSGLSQYLDSLFHGKSHQKMDDDLGVPPWIGNLHITPKCRTNSRK